MELLMRKHLLATATCLCAILVTGGSQGKTQATNSGKTVLEAYVSAWNRHDFAALDKLLTADAIHEDIAWPPQGFRGQGPAQIKDFMRAMIEAQPDLNWHLTTVIEAGPVVAAEWIWTSTYTGESPIGPVVRKRISARGASIVVIENGRIKRFSDYYDLPSAFRELPPGSAADNK
jgi:steroid delta-isomerase-like uncharacterized protein